MTREECVSIVRAISATYPNFTMDDPTETVNGWFLFLEEFDYDTIIRALRTFVNTSNSQYAPSVSQLIDLTYKDADANDLTEADAWGFVRKAIGRSGNYELEEFDKLPETVQRAVGSSSVLHAWAMDENFNESVVQSNFLKSYREELRKQRINRRIPKEDWKQIYDKQQERKAIGG